MTTHSNASGTVAGVSLPVPKHELKGSVPKDGIPAIIDPVFADDWSGLEVGVHTRLGENKTIRPRLQPDDRVIGIARDGEARAYPLRVLNWHEIVNDDLGGPLLVTYCPLCRSGITAKRFVRDTPTVFGISGDLWQSNLVLYDRLTDSLWSQIAATAIRGPMTGTTLDLVPSTITTWSAWQTEHPDTTVLLPPPESNTVRGRNAVRDYTNDPYEGYASSRRVGPGSSFDDDRLHPKALVVGVVAADEAKAYPLEAVSDVGVVNDIVGDRAIVVAVAPDETLVAYDRTVDGTRLEFVPDDRAHMRADGSRWRLATGRAVDGPYDGVSLRRANDAPPLFWFTWVDFHPDTTVYRPP